MKVILIFGIVFYLFSRLLVKFWNCVCCKASVSFCVAGLVGYKLYISKYETNRDLGCCICSISLVLRRL